MNSYMVRSQSVEVHVSEAPYMQIHTNSGMKHTDTNELDFNEGHISHRNPTVKDLRIKFVHKQLDK